MSNEDCISKFFYNEDSVTQSPESNSMSPLKTLETSQDMNITSPESPESDTDLNLSKLTIKVTEPLHILPFFNLTPREMPRSPHCVIEEELSSNPWAMLIATIFLTKTSGKNARPYMKIFFQEYPTPYRVLDHPPECLERLFEKLGLKKRGLIIWKLSYQFVSAKWRRASNLCGIGKYAEDAYRIFCLGHVDLDPDDRYLKLYLDWLRSTVFVEDNSVTDCEYFGIDDPVLNYYRITLRNGV